MITLHQDVCIDLGMTANHQLESISTLGPAGTSSEQAAIALWRWLPDNAGEPEIRLRDSYEEAADDLQAGRVSHLVVANAYAQINRMYMTKRLALVGAFVYDTPHYGLAAPDVQLVPRQPSVASHPAPILLLEELMPPGYVVQNILQTSSTSAAAKAVRAKLTDLALTTSVAARAHDLTFLSRTRPIRMLWSVFARADAQTTDGSQAN
jgi:prephenate dehydratase